MVLNFIKKNMGAKVALVTSMALLVIAGLVLLSFAVLDVELLTHFTIKQLIFTFVGLLIFIEIILVILMTHIFVQKPLEQLTSAMQVSSLTHISKLYEISQTLSQTLELSELTHAVQKILTQTLGANQFSLIIFNSQGDLIIQGNCGFERGERLARISLMASEKALGVLNLTNSFPQGEIRSNLQFYEAIASQIAIAYDRSMLYTRTKELSVTDELTGIYNRRHFQEVFHMEWVRANRFLRPFSLLMVDVDHFKAYNDRFGHLQGDRALKILAKLLTDYVREVDTVARFGGEEFVIILADTALNNALFVGEKIRFLVESKSELFLGERSLKDCFTVSVGIASYPEHARLEAELLSKADRALYYAKDCGRNQVVSASNLLNQNNKEETKPIRLVNQ